MSSHKENPLKRPVVVMCDQRYVELQRELLEHPKLLNKVREANNDLGSKLAAIADYVGLTIDVTLDVEGVHILMENFTQRLRSMRVTVINSAPEMIVADSGLLIPKNLH